MVDILNGKNYPVPELVVHAVFFIHVAQPRFVYQLRGIPLAAQILYQVIAGLIGKAQPELLYRLIRELPVPQIPVPCFTLSGAKLEIEIFGRLFIDFQQPAPLAFRLLRLFGIFDFRQIHPGAVRQHFHRLRKRVILIFLDKGIYIPARAAAEAIIHLLAGRNGKGRRLLIVEWAKAEIIGALFLKAHIA